MRVNIKKALRNVFIALGVLAVLAYGLVLLPNQGADEPLREELRVFLEAKPEEIPSSDNIYVAMLGFHAPEGEDMLEVGRRRLDERAKKFEPGQPAFEMYDSWEALRWQEVRRPFDCFGSKGADFLKCAHLQDDRLERELEANETLAERYELLQKLPLYVAPWFPDSSSVQQIREVQRRLAVDALLAMDEGYTEEGLAFYKEDMALWRRVLEGKRDALWTAMAGVLLSENLRSLSLLLSLPSTKLEGQESQWRELLVPLSKEQLNMRPLVEEGLRLLDYSVRFTGKESSLGLHPNATMNLSAPFFSTWLKLVELPWEDYLEQREEALKLPKKLFEPQLHWLYNPWGKWLFGQIFRLTLADGFWDNEIRKFHELDAHLRMVRLQLELRLAPMPSKDIPAFLEQQNPDFCAPCTDFSWDAEKRELSFQPWFKERWASPERAPSVYVP